MSRTMSPRDSSDLASETDGMLSHEKPAATRTGSRWSGSTLLTLSFLRWVALFLLLTINVGLQLVSTSREHHDLSVGDDPSGLTPKSERFLFLPEYQV